VICIIRKKIQRTASRAFTFNDVIFWFINNKSKSKNWNRFFLPKIASKKDQKILR